MCIYIHIYTSIYRYNMNILIGRRPGTSWRRRTTSPMSPSSILIKLIMIIIIMIIIKLTLVVIVVTVIVIVVMRMMIRLLLLLPILLPPIAMIITMTQLEGRLHQEEGGPRMGEGAEGHLYIYIYI